MERAVVIQEFHISITPVPTAGQDVYLLRTEAVAAGVPLAELSVTWPIETWLAQAQALFQDPLQAILAAPDLAAAGPNQGSEAAIALGQALYQGIFQGRMRDSWLAAQGIAHNRRCPLRLRLGFKDSRLQRLPWELLHDEDRTLATSADVTFCRYYQGPNTVDLAVLSPLAPASDPINVLVVIAAPDDQARLALHREINQLQAELRSPLATPKSPAYPHGQPPVDIQLTVLEQPGRTEVIQALDQGHFQVFHYAGHSDPSDFGGDLYLTNQHTGLTDNLSGDELAGLLINRGVWMTILNSCRGAYTPADDHQAGWTQQNLVQALANRGVPGVIAMADRIPDDVALTFTQQLYRHLRQGYPIDLSLSRVRLGLREAHRSAQPLWMLPLLYLRPGFDGYLYATPPTAETDLESMLANSLLIDPALVPPDYSADADIGGLANEVFQRHGATAQAPAATVATAHPPTDTPPTDWLQDLDSPTADPNEIAAVASLVKQLSAESTAVAAPHDFPVAPPESRPREDGSSLSSTPESPLGSGSAGAAESIFWLPPWLKAMPRNWLAQRSPFPRPADHPLLWGGVGLAGVMLALGTILVLGSRPPAVPEVGNLPPPAVPESSGAAGSSGVVVINAVQALTTDRPAQARRFIEQLLDQRDLAAAQSVIATATPDQLLDADLAFARGRLAWQQAAVAEAGASPNDALRAWGQALGSREDFLDAWTTLGFAYYVLGDTDQAISAWERAWQLDQRQQRDRDPDRPPQVSSELTVHALAGLAMARHQQSEQAVNAEERQQIEAQANEYLLAAVSVDPSLLNSEALATHWLWTPGLIRNWQTTVERLATVAPAPESEDE